jgi:hypothetical protein
MTRIASWLTAYRRVSDCPKVQWAKTPCSTSVRT